MFQLFIKTSRKPVQCMEKLLNMIFKEKIHQIMQSHANCTQYKIELVLVITLVSNVGLIDKTTT